MQTIGNPISRRDALAISMKILLDAERERMEIADEEARIGPSYDGQKIGRSGAYARHECPGRI